MFNFEKIEGATGTVDMLQRYHNPYLGGPRQMLNSTNEDKVLAVRSASSCLEVLSHAHLRRQIGQRSDVHISQCTMFYKRLCSSTFSERMICIHDRCSVKSRSLKSTNLGTCFDTSHMPEMADDASICIV